MCIVYRMSTLSYRIMSRLITIPHIGLANIVAGRRVVREMLQDEANVPAIAAELVRLLDDAVYRGTVLEGLAGVRANLGEGQGARRMAELIVDQLDQVSTG